MNKEALRCLLEEVYEQKLSPGEAMEKISILPYTELGFAKPDHHRAILCGMPEVIFCQGKTPEQVVAIMQELAASGENILATRAEKGVYQRVKEVFPAAQYHELPRLITVEQRPRATRDHVGQVVVVSAGTADLPVAEEAAVTCEFLGCRVERVYDVGVAGLHRLVDQLEIIRQAQVLVVVAGMDGALPSVVAGLVSSPVIAVPTSVGYGTSFQGLAALLSMLNSCASGMAVVNIDNGFGAGVVAYRILRTLTENRVKKGDTP